MSDYDFDVGIIGGGPAGAAMGAYLAKAGVSCCILERELFPREHVGESLVPSSTRIFKDLDFLPEMEAHRFPRKYGATWTSSPAVRPYAMNWDGLDPDCRADIRFDEREQPGVEQNYTYHVDRGEFDLAFLQHANKLGAEVYEGVDVTGVVLGDAPEIRYRFGRGERSARVRMIVDASGRRTVLGSQLKLKVKDPLFDQYAVHTWFEGFDRGDGPAAENIHIHFLPRMYFKPIPP